MSILGIDLGTTNSLACVWKGKEAILIPNAFGSYLTPSVVSFLENGEVLVGEGAKQRLHTHPSLTFAEFKRCMGTDTVYTVHGKTYYPQDLSAMVIRKLVENASVFLNERIEEAIISVPAYFNDDQRWATKIAGQLAGIRVERIINEPVRQPYPSTSSKRKRICLRSLWISVEEHWTFPLSRLLKMSWKYGPSAGITIWAAVILMKQSWIAFLKKTGCREKSCSHRSWHF